MVFEESIWAIVNGWFGIGPIRPMGLMSQWDPWDNFLFSAGAKEGDTKIATDLAGKDIVYFSMSNQVATFHIAISSSS